MARAWLVATLLLFAAVPVESGDYTLWTYFAPVDLERNSAFGSAIATDGDWILVGAPGNDEAYFYQIEDGHFEKKMRLSGPGADFGRAVALDLPWAAIGGPDDSTVEIWHLDDGAWSRHTELSKSQGERFGASLAIEGNRLVVGAPGAYWFGALSNPGSAYIYEFGTTWTLKQTLSKGSLGAENRFGEHVDIHGDRMIIGAPAREIEDQVFQGAAWIFSRGGGTWKEEQKLSVDHEFDPRGSFGEMVAIHGDDAIAGGLPYLVDSFLEYGDLFFFERTAGVWGENYRTEHYGVTVDMEHDRAILGGIWYDMVTLWQKGKSSWYPTEEISSDHTCCDASFGSAVSLEGKQIYVGAPSQDTMAVNGGAVWTFVDNVAPVAMAGPDQTIEGVDGTIKVQFDGSKSYDPDGTIKSYRWTSGDHAVAGAKASLALGPGEHTIALTVTDDQGGSDSDSLKVVITDVPRLEPWFVFSPDKARPDTAIQFTDRSKDGTGIITSWAWDFDGDGRIDDTHQHPTFRFTSAGSHNVRLTVGNEHGVELDVVRQLTVADARPVAHAGYDIIAEGKTGGIAEVKLDGTRSTDDGSIDAYLWTHGGITVGTTAQPTVQLQRGASEIQLTVRDDAGQTARDTVRVLVTPDGPNKTRLNDAPVVDISFTDKGPLHFDFDGIARDEEDEIALWSWDFNGDGVSDSQVEDTKWTFDKTGLHEVTFIATDMEGLSQAAQVHVEINNRDPQADFSPRAFDRVPAGVPVIFHELATDYEGPIASWSWDFGDGATSDHADIGHVFSSAGNHTVTLTVTDMDGQTHSTSGYVNVLRADAEAVEEWDQEVALEAQATGEILFQPPAEEPETADEETTETTQESSKGFSFIKAPKATTVEFSWWWIAGAGSIILLAIIATLIGRR